MLDWPSEQAFGGLSDLATNTCWRIFWLGSMSQLRIDWSSRISLLEDWPSNTSLLKDCLTKQQNHVRGFSHQATKANWRVSYQIKKIIWPSIKILEDYLTNDQRMLVGGLSDQQLRIDWSSSISLLENFLTKQQKLIGGFAHEATMECRKIVWPSNKILQDCLTNGQRMLVGGQSDQQQNLVRLQLLQANCQMATENQTMAESKCVFQKQVCKVGKPKFELILQRWSNFIFV